MMLLLFELTAARIFFCGRQLPSRAQANNLIGVLTTSPRLGAEKFALTTECVTLRP